jgi:hypothetical protein
MALAYLPPLLIFYKRKEQIMLELPDNESPSFESILEVLCYLGSLRYSTANLHTELGNKLAMLSEKHFKRAEYLCKIEKTSGKIGPEQLELIDNVISIMNDKRV